MGHQWLTREQVEKQSAALREYYSGAREARAWLDSLPTDAQAARDALEGRMARVLSEAGPTALAWRDSLATALARLAKEQARRAKLQALLSTYAAARANRIEAEQRRLAQAEAAERAFRAGLASLDAAIAQAQASELEARGSLYDLRGLQKMNPTKRAEILRAAEEAEQAQAREWESYDANPYEPHDSPEEDPFYEERLLAALPMPE